MHLTMPSMTIYWPGVKTFNVLLKPKISPHNVIYGHHSEVKEFNVSCLIVLIKVLKLIMIFWAAQSMIQSMIPFYNLMKELLYKNQIFHTKLVTNITLGIQNRFQFLIVHLLYFGHPFWLCWSGVCDAVLLHRLFPAAIMVQWSRSLCFAVKGIKLLGLLNR